MVMPNRHDGASSPEWWDDLPPEVKRRIARPPADGVPEPAADRVTEAAAPDRSFDRPRVFSDLSRLALFFLIAALANVLFLLIALSFLFNRAAGPN
jgi:hypothetical protein